MTSTANPPNSNPASNTSANSSAPSYASAAGAAKKPTSTPLIATGTSTPPVVVGSSVPAPQHAKSSSVSPVNGRPNIMPAVPAVAHGSSTNGGAAHDRKASVTMSANGPNSSTTNGGAVGGAKDRNIQFGFKESPAVSKSTPQAASAAPIPIPGSNPRVVSPAHSPSPIPQPSASGGRPPSSAQSGQMQFGSFGGNGDSHMRQPSGSQNSIPQNHGRRESMHSVSSASEQVHQGPHGGPGRGGFQQQGGRGRGYNQNYNQQMGYPPNNGFRGGPGQGRGGMPPAFQPQQQRFPNSPQPARGSPHIPPSMPAQGGPSTPNMPHAVPGMPGMPGGPQYFYPPPMGHQHVLNPAPVPNKFSFSQSGKKKGRRDSEKYPQSRKRTDSYHELPKDLHKFRRLSKRSDHRMAMDSQPRHPGLPLESVDLPKDQIQSNSFHRLPPLVTSGPRRFEPLDLSPESGNFDMLLTTVQKQNYGYPPQQFDAMGRGMPMGYPMYPGAHMMHGQPQSPAPGYQQPYVQGQYGPQGGQPMSRNSSQVSERPNSSTSHTQPPPAAQGTPQQQPAQPKAPVVVSTPSSFARPRKSAAIVIKNAAGEALDLSNLKAPASPVPSIQQSKTPPVVASTPTPPPKPATPASHTRTESNATTKTAEEVRNEFKEKMRLAAETEAKAKDEADAKAKAAEEEKLKAEEKAKEEAEAKAKAEAEAEAKAKEEAEAKAKAEAEAKAKEEERLKAEAKAKEEAEAKAKADAEAASQKKDEKPKAADEMDDDELERIIREMEEEDARREKEAEERSAKIAAEKAAKKKTEDESRAANAAENDRKLREQEREMERLEEEKERKRAEAESSGKGLSVADALAQKIGSLKLSDADSTPANVTDKLSKLSLDSKSPPASAKGTAAEKRGKPAALNLAPLNTKTVEPAQPSAALQSLKSARFLHVINQDLYPAGIHSPNPALNSAVTKKGKTFKYDPNFLLQFKGVFTEQPSMEFGQQVKTLIGDGDGGSRSGSTRTPASASARQNSRGGAGGFPPIGSFGAGAGGRTLPPGTSSQERFALSQATMGRQQMAAFSRPGGAFPMGAGMQRTPSSSNMAGPNSPRQGSRSTRNASKRDTMNAKAEAQAAKTMPLTAGMKIDALQTSTTGWKPSSVGQKQGPTPGSDHMDPAMVQRKVKAALNKMTPENFDKISAQILAIAAQSKDETDGLTLRQVIQLTFEKATDEAHWASMYAKFCKRMLEMMSPEIRDENILDKNGQVVSGGALFRKYLLNRCQEEFERGWKTEDKEGETAEDKKKALEAAMLSDEYYKQAAAKRRGLGLVQFIGELYKLGMLTERIMHECVRKLVDYTSMPDEAEIESLSKLLKTIGGNLDATEKSRAMMDVYFGRVQNMMDIPELPSRMKFMLMDVIDLRKAGWHSKEENKGPKTLDEVRAEAEAQAARKAAEAARTNQRGGPGGRPPMGRGDSRQFSSGFPQQNQNQVGMDDLRRLKGAVSRSSSQNVTLGPTSMFSSRSNSGRRLGPGGSLGRGAEDSAPSSRTGTPPTAERSSSNAFSLLATMDTDNPTSPPSTAASPALSKVTPATGDKKESN